MKLKLGVKPLELLGLPDPAGVVLPANGPDGAPVGCEFSNNPKFGRPCVAAELNIELPNDPVAPVCCEFSAP